MFQFSVVIQSHGVTWYGHGIAMTTSSKQPSAVPLVANAGRETMQVRFSVLTCMYVSMYL